MSNLFSPYKIKNLELKNRIVMSPMSMYACKDGSGLVQDWHRIHYPARAVGGVGLVIIESTAVTKQGRMGPTDLGIWEDGQVEGLRDLVNLIKGQGAAVGMQLNHAGRKAKIDDPIAAPSSIAFSKGGKVPEELTKTQINQVVEAFGQSARRCTEAGFDVVEIHAAHGYLLHEFLSPVTNYRTDEYGGSPEDRFRILKEVIEKVQSEWMGPLFVRISATDQAESGNTIEDSIVYAKWLKELGVDLIDVSNGLLTPAKAKTFPGYQVLYAESIRKEAEIATGAVGKVIQPEQAEEIISNGRADLVFIGRELLVNPHWTYYAANRLNYDLELPQQYSWSWIKTL